MKVNRKSVKDSGGNDIRKGDTVRHGAFGRDEVVTSTHTTARNGVRYHEVDVPGGPWDPKDVRKIS